MKLITLQLYSAVYSESEGCNILSDDIDVDRRLTVVTSRERERLPPSHCLQLPVRDGRDGQAGDTQHSGGDQEGHRQGEGAEREEETGAPSCPAGLSVIVNAIRSPDKNGGN